MWNLQRAVEYRAARRSVGGLQGMKDMMSLDPGKAGVLEKGSARAGYDQAKNSANSKVTQARANAPRAFGEKVTLAGLAAGQIAQDVRTALELNPLLQELGGYLAFMSDAELICGPPKKATDALRKTMGDYIRERGFWTNNKDLVRCTLASQTQQGLLKIVRWVKDFCSPRYGLQLIKNVETKPTSKDNACGYSGWNFVVVFKDSRIPAEIQANTFAMMYGKMSRESYTKAILGGADAEYTRTEQTMGFPGGLSHLFYEVWRVDKSGKDGMAAAELGRWYSDLCRMEDAERKAHAPKCGEKYVEFVKAIKTEAAKKKVADHPFGRRWLACACASDTCYIHRGA